ncbi:MAG: FUSC family protein, partial [Rubripirellula sp.]
MLVPDPPARTVSADGVNLRQAFKLALSLVLFYFFALTVNWDVPNYGSLAIVLVSLGTRGASLQKGILRVVGTTVGVAIGYCLLALFAQDRWGALIAFSVYLLVVSYGMQASRFGYAWFVAAFVPLVIWGDNYPSYQNAFYFGTFRWLETTAGIVIYTIVDMVIWPRHAGDQFRQQRIRLWGDARGLLHSYKQRFSNALEESEIAQQREKMAGLFTSSMGSFEQACIDTPDVLANRDQWRVWGDRMVSFLAALDLCYETFEDCKKYGLREQVKALAPILDTLERRIECIGRLEQEGSGSGSDTRPELDSLTSELPIDSVADPMLQAMSPTERPVYQCLIEQLHSLDRSSRDILELLLVKETLPERSSEANHDTLVSALTSVSLPQQRWLRATYPATVFVLGFLFWVFVNPPTGPKVPMMAGIFALMVVLNRINPIPLFVLMVASTLFVVAPVYWLIMPKLSTGEGLLVLVFIYAFVFAYLAGKNPAFKMGPLIMFVNMTGISNEQTYSFEGPIDGAMMTLLAGVIVALVFVFYRAMRPEVAVVRDVRMFFRGCASVAKMYRPDSQGTQEINATSS